MQGLGQGHEKIGHLWSRLLGPTFGGPNTGIVGGALLESTRKNVTKHQKL